MESANRRADKEQGVATATTTSRNSSAGSTESNTSPKKKKKKKGKKKGKKIPFEETCAIANTAGGVE